MKLSLNILKRVSFYGSLAAIIIQVISMFTQTSETFFSYY